MMSEINRRAVLSASGAMIGLSTTSSLRAKILAGGADLQVARVEPVVDDYYGTKVTDNYRWMENPKDPDWLPFLRSQNDRTRATLDSIPGRRALAERIAALSGDTAATSQVTAAGDLLFYEQRPAGTDNYKLFVRERDGKVRTLVDPTVMKVGETHVSLDWWTPSYDGRHITYGLSSAGSEASVLHIMETATGRVLPESIENTDFGVSGWLPDNSGFFILHLSITAAHQSSISTVSADSTY